MTAELPNDGGAAFPWDAPFIHERGISARDYFAAAALTGYASNPESGNHSCEEMAQWSYDAADAMLKARALASRDDERGE